MQYLIYLRSPVPTEKRSCGEGETLARHEKAPELARRQHLPIADIYRSRIRRKHYPTDDAAASV